MKPCSNRSERQVGSYTRLTGEPAGYLHNAFYVGGDFRHLPLQGDMGVYRLVIVGCSFRAGLPDGGRPRARADRRTWS